MTKEYQQLKTFSKQNALIVNKEILNILTDKVDKEFQEMITYHMKCGGKRLRPLIATLSCQALGGSQSKALKPAAALEILHNYTLVTDDVIDHGEFRRGKPTVWKKFGPGVGECVFMVYAASIFDFEYADKKAKDEINKLLVRILKAISNGQINDILLEQHGRLDEPYVLKNRKKKPTKKDYLHMVRQKTATLLGSSAELGAICAGKSNSIRSTMYDFGFNLGLAFQIQDDILDLFGDEKKFGKKIGKDILEHKLGNHVIIEALKELSLKDKKELLGIIRSSNQTQTRVKRAIEIIKKTNSLEKSRKAEAIYSSKAKQALGKIKPSKYRIMLEDLVDYLTHRDY